VEKGLIELGIPHEQGVSFGLFGYSITYYARPASGSSIYLAAVCPSCPQIDVDPFADGKCCLVMVILVWGGPSLHLLRFLHLGRRR
jgi:hypothetical protein